MIRKSGGIIRRIIAIVTGDALLEQAPRKPGLNQRLSHARPAQSSRLLKCTGVYCGMENRKMSCWRTRAGAVHPDHSLSAVDLLRLRATLHNFISYLSCSSFRLLLWDYSQIIVDDASQSSYWSNTTKPRMSLPITLPTMIGTELLVFVWSTKRDVIVASSELPSPSRKNTAQLYPSNVFVNFYALQLLRTWT